MKEQEFREKLLRLLLAMIYLLAAFWKVQVKKRKEEK